MRVLDIGSGWGGLGLYLAEACGAEVAGVTLSEEQHALSNERAPAARRRATASQFQLMDYRAARGHIRPHRLGRHVRACRRRPLPRILRQDAGRCSARRRRAPPFDQPIRRARVPPAPGSRNISSPAATFPALSEVVPAIEQSGLYVTDIEILRLHYAETLREWRRRFADRRDRAKASTTSASAGCGNSTSPPRRCAFRYAGMNNFQIQFAHQHALPLTAQLHAARRKIGSAPWTLAGRGLNRCRASSESPDNSSKIKKIVAARCGSRVAL